MANTVICPTTGTFGPGHDTMGMCAGTSLPTELQTYHPTGNSGVNVGCALVWYNSKYSATGTKPQVKYAGILFYAGSDASGNWISGWMFFNAYVADAAVSQTAVIQFNLANAFNDISGLGGAGNTGLSTLLQLNDMSNNLMVNVGQDDVNGDSVVQGFCVTEATPMWRLLSNVASTDGGGTKTGALITANDIAVETGSVPTS
jgi:hypothetical protein